VWPTWQITWEDKSGGLYLTEDGGQTWRRIGREGPQTFGGYFHPKREGWIYMTLTEGAPGAGLWLSLAAEEEEGEMLSRMCVIPAFLSRPAISAGS
jgi:hypothetical protein